VVALLWTLPAFLFYLLIFASKPGYVLTYLAPLAALGAGLAARSSERLGAGLRAAGSRAAAWFGAAVAAVSITAGSYLFLFADPTPGQDRVGISLPHLQVAEDLLERSLVAAAREEQEAGPGRTAFVVNLWLPDWRRFMYYYPGAPAWHLIYWRTYPGIRERREVWLGLGRRTWRLGSAGSETAVPLGSKVTRLVILSGDLERELAHNLGRYSRMGAPSLRSDRGFQYLVIELDQTSILEAPPFRFDRRVSLPL
jgi:hypothetical protein